MPFSWEDAISTPQPTQAAQPSSGAFGWDEAAGTLAKAPSPAASQGVAGKANSFLSGLTSGALGNLADYGGATMAAPYLPMVEAITGDKMPGYTEMVQGSKDTRARMEAANPLTAMGGRVVGALVPGIAAAPALGFTAPAAGGALATTGAIGSYLGRNALFGAGLGAMEGDNPSDRFWNAVKGGGIGVASGVAAPAVGAVTQGLWNVGKSGVNALRQVTTGAGREGVAGQILREANDGFSGPTATSNLTTLRTAQETGSPGMATLERMLDVSGGNPASRVQAGRTPQQVQDVLQALPGYAEGAPSALLADNSRAGVQAIQSADQVLNAHTRTLWQDPRLSTVKLDGNAIKQAGHATIDQMPASWRAAFDSAEGAPLRPFRQEISELPPNPSILDVNAVVSRLRTVARDAGSGPTPNPVVAAAANRTAEGLLDAVQSAPGMTRNARAAFNAARTATRTRYELTGYNEIGNILHPSASGNIQADPSRAFGAFFTSPGGEGGYRLSNLAGYLRGLDTPEATAAADAIRETAQRHIGLNILRGANPIDNMGMTSANLGAVERNAAAALPDVQRNPMLRQIAPALQDVQNTSAALMRPTRSRGDANSTTFEKLQKNDLLNAVIGQAGAAGLGAPLGAAAAYQWGPEGVPAWARMGAGFAGGAMAGKRMGPLAVNALTHSPILRGAQTGMTAAVRDQLEKALADPVVARALIARQLYQLPGFGQPGAISQTMQQLAPLGVPLAIGMQRQ